MIDSSFIFNYLPSFYSKILVNDSGIPLFKPLFDIYATAAADAYYQAQQISTVPYLEKAPFFIKETYTTIDTLYSNSLGSGYKIDNSIVYLEGIYLDGEFTTLLPYTAKIYHNNFTNTRYILFYQDDTLVDLPIAQKCLFIKSCYKDLKTLQNTFGYLLNYNKHIPDLTNTDDDIEINYTNILADYKIYKNKLLAILYGRMNGPTMSALNIMIGMFLQLPYSTVDGIIRRITENISIGIEDSVTKKIIDHPVSITGGFNIGDEILKYELLQKNTNFLLYDQFSNPARFTQALVGNNSHRLIELLTLNYNDNEQDASLFFDSGLYWDAPGLYWDMGNHSGLYYYYAPGDIIAPNELTGGGTNISRFDTQWYDSRFNGSLNDLPYTPQIYEMLRNVSILEINSSVYSPTDIAEIVDILKKIIPKYCKLLVYSY